RSPKVINNYLKDPKTYGTRKSPGRPKKLSPRDERKIVRAAAHSTKGCRQIKNDLRLNVGKTTVWRTLKSSPYIAREIMEKIPSFKPHHKIARLEFATDHMTWNNEWSNMVALTIGGGSVMIWEAFSSNGKAELAIVPTRMNSNMYIDILENHLKPYMDRHKHEKLIFQQDNASVHANDKFLLEIEIVRNRHNVLASGFTKPKSHTKNVWGILVRKIYENGKQFENIRELEVAIRNAWQTLLVQTLKKLTESMPKRIFQVINRNGGHTDY
uniref:HTH_Tnp_Tc3_2 domain-containing protein n=1 Tax=Anopheles funestus TaxID=62324 RepID=A0A182S022_ANOFN